MYFSVFDWPADGRLVVPGIQGTVGKATLLAGGKTLETEKTAGALVIHVPATAPDALATVIKVDMQ